MIEQFVLQTIWREKDILRLLVELDRGGWRLCTHAVDTGELPIEAALRYAEQIFGLESVCTLWKLGQVTTDGKVTSVFCLDTETIEGFAGSDAAGDMVWITEEQFFQQIPKNLAPLLEKIRQPGLNK